MVQCLESFYGVCVLHALRMNYMCKNTSLNT